MDFTLEKLIQNKSPEEISQILININKFQLERKKHIKKYNKLRNLHSDILGSMEGAILEGKYNINESINSISKYIQKEVPEDLDLYLNLNDKDDKTILNELLIYKNHPKLKSITEIYLEKNKFRNKEKVKLLNSMNNSYVGLFKVIAVDRDNGYITYQDVFTKKRFKVIDISMSSTLVINKSKMIYSYNRIITYEDISFATGIHCMMPSDNKLLQDFIKKHKYKDCSDFSRCIMLYDLSKKDKEVKVIYNNKYGKRK